MRSPLEPFDHISVISYHCISVISEWTLWSRMETAAFGTDYHYTAEQHSNAKKFLAFRLNDGLFPKISIIKLIFTAARWPHHERIEWILQPLNLPDDELIRRSPKFESRCTIFLFDWGGSRLIDSVFCAWISFWLDDGHGCLKRTRTAMQQLIPERHNSIRECAAKTRVRPDNTAQWQSLSLYNPNQFTSFDGGARNEN